MPALSRVTGRDERVALLGALAPLFDDRFVRSCDLYESYVEALACQSLIDTGLAAAWRVPRTVDEAIAVAALAPAVARVPAAWLAALLAARGVLEWVDGRFRCIGSLDTDAVALRAAQAAHDAGCLPAYDLAAYAARHYRAVLAGATAGEAVLASPEALDLWTGYFSNDNALYAVSNVLGASAAARVLATRGGTVLELGAGLGSAAQALLERSPPGSIDTYRFTDASPLFLRRARRALQPRFGAAPLRYDVLDLDRPFAAGSIAPGSVALVYAVNVLHVAHDLAATLGEIRAALAPGGALVFAECVRPAPGGAVHAEIAFNLLDAFRAPRLEARWRPTGGFLTVAQWTDALHANGFGRVEVMPDVDAIRAHYPSFVVAAFTARSA
jgi:SAM-dependent methyltransferase